MDPRSIPPDVDSLEALGRALDTAWAGLTEEHDALSLANEYLEDLAVAARVVRDTYDEVDMTEQAGVTLLSAAIDRLDHALKIAERRHMTDRSDEPELQHAKECLHPTGPCLCPRPHLLAEGRRLRNLVLDQTNAAAALADRDALADVVNALVAWNRSARIFRRDGDKAPPLPDEDHARRHQAVDDALDALEESYGWPTR